jgi:hypothetical protein
MSSYEVSAPIINPPYEKPRRYWYIQEGEEPQRREGRSRMNPKCATIVSIRVGGGKIYGGDQR